MSRFSYPSPRLAAGLILTIEIAYWFAARLVASYHPQGWSDIEFELFRSAMRITATLALWWCFKGAILSRSSTRNIRAVHPGLLVGIVIFLIVPLACADMKLQGNFQWIYAATSICVGLHEELLWRGVILNALARRFPTLFAVVLCNGLFTAWHYGMMAPHLWTFAQVFVACAVLSIVYIRTGSIMLAIGLHSVYDVIVALSPFMKSPLPLSLGVAMLLAAWVSVSLDQTWQRRTISSI